MDARRGEADHRVAGRDIGARQQCAALGGTDRETRKIVVAVLVEPGHFRGFAADQGTAGFPAAFRDARDDGRRGLGIELAAGKIVQKEQRLGALDDEVIDRHRHQIDPDAAVQAGFDGDLELGADPVGGGDQNRVLEARGFQIEQPTEPADLGVRAGPGGCANHRLDEIDQTVAGVDIDARVRVSEPVFAVGHARFQMIAGWLRRISPPCNGSQARRHVLCRQPAGPGHESPDLE